MIKPTYDWNRLFFGQVEAVFNPSDAQNSGKYQFEYQVLVTVDNYAQIPVRCIKMDPYGSYSNYEDAKLAPGYRVFVMFPRGDRSLGVIMGGSRQYNGGPQQASDGYYWRHRFNGVNQGVDLNGFWKVISDQGPFASVTTSQVILNDGATESIVLDKAAQTLTVNSNTLKVIVNGDATVQVGGNAQVTVTGKLVEKAAEIDMNRGGSDPQNGITTGNSHQGVVDFITGVPVEPSTTVFGDV